MKFRTKTNSEVNINLTPLIDVVFLLLIFFMVTTTFKKNTQLKVVLPHTSTQSTAIEKEVIRVSIDQAGQYELGSVIYPQSDLENLSAALKNHVSATDTHSERLLIMGDKNAPHQSLVSLLEVASELGIENIRIMAQHNDTEKNVN